MGSGATIRPGQPGCDDRRQFSHEKGHDRLPLAGVVLAGGASSRFGRNKALHTIGGRAMIEHVVAQVKEVASDVSVSVARTNDELTEWLSAARMRCVVDRLPGRGPLSGLHAALLESTHDWLMVVPCDVPLIRSSDLRRIADACIETAQAVIARDETGRLHPLCACYHRSVLAQVERLLSGLDYSIHTLLETVNVVTVEVEADYLCNVNRIVDLPTRLS